MKFYLKLYMSNSPISMIILNLKPICKGSGSGLSGYTCYTWCCCCGVVRTPPTLDTVQKKEKESNI